jgi:cytochrome b561
MFVSLKCLSNKKNWSNRVCCMKATWESVLRLVTVGVFVLITSQVILYTVFPDRCDRYWLSITIFVCILVLIVFRIVWRVATKRFPYRSIVSDWEA